MCAICFWRFGPGRSRAPVEVAAVQRGRSMPFCEDHLGTAFAVGLSVQRLIPAHEALDALLDIYGVEELSLLDAIVAGAETTSGTTERTRARINRWNGP